MSSPEYTHDLMNEIINSILVEDNRFIWNFSYNKTENADTNISVDGTKRCPVISIDGEIMGTPSGVPDFLHISEDNSLDLPAEIRNNPLFAKNLSLILHLHRLLLDKQGVLEKSEDLPEIELSREFRIDFKTVKAFRKSGGNYLRANQWEDLNVEVRIS